MPDVEIARLRSQLTRLIVALCVVAILCGLLALGGLIVAWRAIDTADNSRARSSERITQLQERIKVLEDRGLTLR